MNKIKIVAPRIILILLFTSTLLFFHSSQSSSSESLTMVENAVNFLVNEQFNQSLGLCREAPNTAPNTYWLVSDNLWAWKALSIANEYSLSNAAQAEATADTIKAKLIELAANYDLPTDSNGLPESYAHEAVIGDVASQPYNTGADYTLYNGDYVLKTTMYNGTNPMPNWDQYADLLLYAALSCHWQGNDSGALVYYNNATQMWNQTSEGLQDNATSATYATYKLALLLYTSKVLGESPSFEPELVERIYSEQRESDGGIRTDYYSNGNPSGDANTETTAIVIIALLTPPGPELSIDVSPTSSILDIGHSLLFTSEVQGGILPYMYQWYLNDTAVQDATLSNWTFTPTSSGSYTVYLNANDSVGGNATSNTATVTVNAPPAISVAPVGPVTLDVSQSQTFNSTISGGTSPYTYQWYLNGTLVSPAIGSTWTFTATSAGSYTVYVNVSDDVGAQAMSNTATVTASPVTPEFPSYLILPILIIVTLLATIVSRRKWLKHQIARATRLQMSFSSNRWNS